MIADEIPVAIMTSDVSDWTLGGMLWTLRRRWRPYPDVHVFGYRNPPFKLHEKYPGTTFHRIGNFAHYPANKWSDSLLAVMERMRLIGHSIFVLLLDDYWIIRDVDTAAIGMLYDYMLQFGYTLKIDLDFDRLSVNEGESFSCYRNTYGHVSYIDLIRSPPGSFYHMSLWGGLFNTSRLLDIIVPGETAQEVELNGHARLTGLGEDVLVLGTRQAPLVHINVIHAGRISYRWKHKKLGKDDLRMMIEDGVQVKLK